MRTGEKKQRQKDQTFCRCFCQPATQSNLLCILRGRISPFPDLQILRMPLFLAADHTDQSPHMPGKHDHGEDQGQDCGFRCTEEETQYREQSRNDNRTQWKISGQQYHQHTGKIGYQAVNGSKEKDRHTGDGDAFSARESSPERPVVPENRSKPGPQTADLANCKVRI